MAVVDHVQQISMPSATYHAFIDMPIGLNRTGSTRKCDVQLCAKLPISLKSSVFSPPVEEAAFVATYREACDINERITEKKY